jgi:hypothetical protein
VMTVGLVEEREEGAGRENPAQRRTVDPYFPDAVACS